MHRNAFSRRSVASFQVRFSAPSDGSRNRSGGSVARSWRLSSTARVGSAEVGRPISELFEQVAEWLFL